MKWFRITFWVFVILAVLLALFLAFYKPPQTARAAGTNINAANSEHFAWNDMIGWIDFYGTNTVMVGTSSITGYASSAASFVALDCSTSPIGNTCGVSNYGVCNGRDLIHQTDGTCSLGSDSGSGWLSGYAWNDLAGWISFSCINRGGYPCDGEQVRILPDGTFDGWAWSDSIGWISFNCVNTPQGCAKNYKVKSAWTISNAIGYLESSVFDTQVQGGAVLNSILWKEGVPSVGTCVSFQTAGSNNPAGPWNFLGPGGDGNTYYGASCDAASGIAGGTGCAPKNTSICVNPLYTQNYRYVKYKVRLQSDAAQTTTPVVTDIILNWSR